MAVNSIVFGGVDSADYGIYISGEGVFDAPKRDVEMIEIPGRNGAFALDNGRFENIEVTYPAFNFEPNDYETFAQNLSDFRNALCSQKGYQRLTDSFHPDEYRMAVYREGLDVKPVKYNTASEFNIVFDCKPQRWLTSGETEVTIASSGDTLTNPTLFESSPMLEVKGYGTIEFNGYEIVLENETMGEVILVNSGTKTQVSIPQGMLNAGDSINIRKATFIWRATKSNSSYKWVRTSYSKTADSNAHASTTAEQPSTDTSGAYTFTTTFTDVTLTYGTSKTETNNVSATVVLKYSGTDYTSVITAQQQIVYTGQSGIYFNHTVTKSGGKATASKVGNGYADITGESSMSLLGNSTYIDCDLGEAYKIVSTDVISLNKYIDLGSQLPTLSSGANMITFDNTITDFKVIPRWWKI